MLAKKKFLILIFILLIGFYHIADFTLNKTDLNKYVVGLIKEKIEKVLESKVSISGIHFNILLLKVKVKEVIFVKKQKNLILQVKIPQLTTRLSPWGIFFGEVRLANLRLVNASVEVDRYSVESKAKKKVSGSEFDFDLKKNFIDRLILDNISFVYKLATDFDHTLHEIKKIHLDVKAIKGLRLEGHVLIDKFEVKKNGTRLFDPTFFESDFIFTRNIVSLDHLLLVSGQSRFSGDIEGAFFRNNKSKKIEKFSANSQLEGQIDFEALGQSLKIKDTEGLLKIKNFSQFKYDFNKNKVAFFHAEGEAFSSATRISDFNLLDSIIRYELDQKGVHFKEVNIIKQDQQIGWATGTLDFKKEVPFSFMINLDRASLQNIFEIVGVKNDKVDLFIKTKDLSLKGQGEPIQIKITGPAQVSEFYLLELIKDVKSPFVSTCGFDVEINIDNKHLDFGHKTKGNCSLSRKAKKNTFLQETTVGNLAIKGDIEFDDDVDLNFSSDKLDFSFVSTFLPVELEGLGNVNVSVLTRDKKAVSNIEYSSIGTKVEKIPLLSSNGQLVVKEDTLYLNGVTVYEGLGNLLVHGLIDFSLESFNIKARSESIDQEAIVALREHFFPNWPLSFATKALVINVDGFTDKPLAARGSLDAFIEDVYWDKEKVFDSFSTLIKRDLKAIQIERCIGRVKGYYGICKGGIKQNYSGGFQNQTQEEFDLFSDDSINIIYKVGEDIISSRSKILHLPFLDTYLRSNDLSLIHTINGALYGTLGNLNTTVSGSLEEILYKDDINISKLNYNLTGNNSGFEVYFQQDGKTFFGRIIAELKETSKPFKAYFKFDQFDMRFLFPKIFYSDPRNFSYLTCDLSFFGFLDDLVIDRAVININNLYSNYFYEFSGESKSLEIVAEKSYRFVLNSKVSNSQKKLEPFKVKSKYFTLGISGLERILQKNTTLNILGEVNLELLSQIYSRIEFAKGYADITGSLKIKEDMFEYSFKARNKLIGADDQLLDSFTLMIPEWEPQFENILFDIDYTNGVFYFNNLFSEKGEGSLSLEGSFVYNNEEIKEASLLSLELTNAAFNFKMPYLKEVETVLSGNLFLKEKTEPYQLYGNIVVNKLNSSMNYSFAKEAIRAIQKRKLTQSLSSVTRKESFLFDVDISSDKSISINNTDMNLIGSGNVKLLGSDKRAALTGIIQTEKGRFRYKRDFTIERCYIYFDESDNLDPSIDIKANSIIDNYTVSLNVLGKVSGALVDFDINPGISRADNQPINNIQIMYLISQGRLPESNSFSGGWASLNYAAEILPLDILDDFLGTNSIRVRPEFKDSGGDSSPVGLSAYFNVRKDLDIKIQANSVSRANLSFQYQFNNNISSILDMNVGDYGKSDYTNHQRVNLKFNFPF